MAKREVIVELRLEDQGAVQRLGRLEIETKGLQTELRLLNAEIRKNGVATKEQQLRVGELTARIRANQGVTRELKNDLSGLTEAGLRFRDKMADAAKAGLGAFGLNILGVTAGVTALVGVLRNASQTVINFQQSQANLASILGVSRADIEALTQSAIELGPALGRLPAEVTDLQTELAKLGFTERDILNAQEAVILLANATGEELGKSAEVAAATLKGFGLETTETQRVVDVMAQSFNATSLDLEKFSVAISTVAPAAKSAGFSLEETTTLVGVLADRGLDASVAGTSLRSIFQDLAKTGMTLDEALDMIQGSTNKNATAFELFGERAASAGIILSENRGEIDRVTASLNDAGGAADKMAREQLDTLKGAIDRLSAAWDTFIFSLDKGDGVMARVARGAVDLFAGILGEFSGANKTDVERTVDAFVDSVNKRLENLGQLQTGASESLSAWVDQQTTLIRTFVRNNIADSERIGQARVKIQQEVQKALAAGDQREVAFALTKLEFFDAEVAARAKVADAATKQAEAEKNAAATQVTTLALLKEQLKEAKEQVEQTDIADRDLLATRQASVKALEAEIAALEGRGAALARSAPVTVDPIAPIDVAGTVDATNPLPVPTPEQRTEAENALIAYNLFAEQQRLNNIIGVQDWQNEYAVLDAQWKAGLLKSDEEYYARKKALDNAYAQAKVQQEQAALQAASAVIGGLAANMEEGSDIQKGFAILQATVNTYLAASQALAEQGTPYILKIANAAAAVLAGLAYVQKIQSAKPQFAEGGYTSPGPKYKPAGVVHAGEWVAPAWQVNHPSFAPVIDWLEEQRKARGGATSVPYAAGGLVRGVAMVNAAPEMDLLQIENAVAARLAFDRPVHVDVVDINKMQGRERKAEVLATA